MGLLIRAIRSIFKPTINKAKGSIGEIMVSHKLNFQFGESIEHRQINDLIIVDEHGKSHQIDHIEIRQNGIFCIETKNYSGIITGSENQRVWTQHVGYRKYRFVNPIRQNRSHIYYLRKALGNKYKINSLVVMVQNNAGRIAVPYVVNLCNLKWYLSSYDDGTNYSVEEMDDIYRKLLSCARTDVTKYEHVLNIEKTKRDIAEGICPRCGGNLILRNGQYGNFYGCSNYPKCKFTKKLH